MHGLHPTSVYVVLITDVSLDLKSLCVTWKAILTNFTVGSCNEVSLLGLHFLI